MPSIRIFHHTMSSKTVLLLCCGVLIAFSAWTQDVPDFALRAALKTAAPNKAIHLAARGNERILAAEVKKRGGVVLQQLPGLITFRIAAKEVSGFARHRAVEFIEFDSGQGYVLNDSMLYNNRVMDVHLGQAWPDVELTGKDVVMGLVDSGIELAHPDFQHADGTTRIKYLWDQNQNGTAPLPFGYGVEWTAADIDAGITGHQDQPQYFGHGSTVTGSAAGNGLAVDNYKGVAPESDLIIVSSGFGLPNWSLTVADAVQYIFEKADELGKPAVVNLSLGTYTGSHDGLDAAALVIDSLVNAKPGRAVVCAVGNSGNWPAYHLDYEVTADTAFTWFQYNANSALGYGAVFFELWADTADFNNVQFAVGADRVNPSLKFRGATGFRSINEVLNAVVSDTLIADGNRIAVVDYAAGLRGGQYRLQVHLATPDSSQYRFRFMTTGSGKFDVWSASTLGTSNMIASGLPAQTVFPDIANYRAPDKFKHMVSSWAASPNVIAVSNYTNRDEYIDINGNLQQFAPPQGILSVNSSWGPTRDNRQKPEVAASGDMTLSSGKLSVLAAMINNEPFKVAPGGMHYRNGGTSMASPVVAGALALLLEQCPYADVETLRQAIIEQVYLDAFTGDSSSVSYGYGKLDVAAAVQSRYFKPEFVHDLELHQCTDETTMLQLTDDYSAYSWSTGEETPQIVITEPGIYSVQVMDGNGCRSRSDSVTVWFHDAPEVFIELHVDTLIAVAPDAVSYQWLLSGVPIEGATDSLLIPQENGIFSLMVTDAHGCVALSDEIAYVVTSLPESATIGFTVYPNPAKDEFFISCDLPVEEIQVWSVEGKLHLQMQLPPKVGDQIAINTSNWSPGVYFVQIRTSEWTATSKLIFE